MLQGYLQLSMTKIQSVEDDFENFKRIREELRKIMKKRTERIIEKNKSVEIMDHTYDIHKVQRQKKYESNSEMRKLNIEGTTYEGTLDILKGMERKIKSEVEDHEEDHMDEPSEEEMEFLMEMDCTEFSETEKEHIIGETTEDECEYILKEQVNLDSSPDQMDVRIVCFTFYLRRLTIFATFLLK